MADKSDLVLLSNQGLLSFAQKGARSSLVERGRKDAATLGISLSQGSTFISSQILKVLIARTFFAISTNETRKALNYALLVIEPSSLTMVATDGYCLSFVAKPNEQIQGIRAATPILIPWATLYELRELLLTSNVEKLEFGKIDDRFSLQVGIHTISWIKAAEEFPDYEAVMPPGYASFAVVRAGELSGAIIRAVQFAYNNSLSIRMRLEENTLKISSADTYFGEGEETINTRFESEPLVVGFNSKYILDYLLAFADEDELRIEIKDSTTCGQIRPEGEDGGYRCRFLLMPMRIDPTYARIPTEFTISLPASVLRTLILDTDFEKLDSHGSALLVLTRSSMGIVVRDQNRLSRMEATTELIEGLDHERRLLIPHETMHDLQVTLTDIHAEKAELAESEDGFILRVGHRIFRWMKDKEGQWRDYEAVMPPTDFSISLPSKIIETLIDSTIFAVSKDESYYTPDGSLLVIEMNSLSMVATDGHRLSFAEMASELNEGVGGKNCILIVREVLPEIKQLLTASQSRKLEFAESEEAFSFRIDDRVLSWARPVSKHKFPDYEAILLDERENIAIVRASELREAIRRVCGPAGWDQKIHLLMRLEKGELKIGFESAKGEKCEESIGALYSGESLATGFYTPYILDFLDALGDVRSVRLTFKNAQSAMEMRPEPAASDLQWRYFVMPRKSS